MSKPKKLYKIDRGRKIDGVCGGIAEYFELDPTLVRVGWLIFAFCVGGGVIAYFIAALIMPRKCDVIDY